MPLHLLGKKSWNPYAPAAIARVKADEDAAAAQEQALDEKKDEHDAEVRLARLRGENPPALPAELGEKHTPAQDRARKRERDTGRSDARKKQCRLAGEDDTDRDLRLAREEQSETHQAKSEVEQRGRGANKPPGNVPIIDHMGHIQLFAPDADSKARTVEKNAEAEKERNDRERGFEDQYTMRFANAAGFKHSPKDAPWYGRNTLASRDQEGTIEPSVGRNAFGREDRGRHQRDAARVSSSDPMAAMKAAQGRLKEVEKQRQHLQKDREMELMKLKADQERDEKRQKRHRHRHRDRERKSHRHDNLDELEDFSLDTDVQHHHSRNGNSHRNDKHEDHRHPKLEHG